MSNNYWEDEDEDLEQEVQLTGDDLVKKLRKAKRADEKRIKELSEKLESLSKLEKERTVNDVLAKKGVNAKAARLILKDIEDVNEQTVNNWLEDNADLLGIKVATKESNVSETDLAALRQQDVLTQGAVSPDREQDLTNKIDNAQSMDELLNLLRGQ